MWGRDINVRSREPCDRFRRPKAFGPPCRRFVVQGTPSSPPIPLVGQKLAYMKPTQPLDFGFCRLFVLGGARGFDNVSLQNIDSILKQKYTLSVNRPIVVQTVGNHGVSKANLER